VGDGQKLAPIDYMVWKDHVNVLDQRRIFRLLSKGPRLEGYLTQLKTADKLDFASWGGFAQNFAGRRIPFEHSSSIPVWERAHSENLFIPTFATSPSGPYLPATAIKGALRTGAVFDRWTEKTLGELASRMAEDSRLPRNPAAKAEDAVLGGHAGNRMRRVTTADSAPVAHTGMKIYLLRTSTMVARGSKFELGWKSARGTGRVDDSTPVFAEMAAPGMVFEGLWKETSAHDRQKLFQASNSFAASQIQRHKAYAEATGLNRLAETLGELDKRVQGAASHSCVLSLGWGAGMLSKISVGDTADPSYRSILRHVSLYQRAVQTGLPFPKTRRIVFEAGRPAFLPGWVLLEVN
jgi:CRISPR-associated protein Csm5